MKYYFGVAEQSGDGWWISFPGIPGVISAGHTWIDLMDNARDALLSAFEALEEDGLAIPPDAVADPSSAMYDPADYEGGRAVMVAVPGGDTPVEVDLDPGLLARLDEIAVKTSSSRTALLKRGAQMVLAADRSP